MVDRNGHPLAATTSDAKGDERKQVKNLLAKADIKKMALDYDLSQMIILEADKGYDTGWLRQDLLNIGIFPAIPFRQYKRKSPERPHFSEVKEAFKFVSCRWAVERAFAWIKRRARRLLLRWERKLSNWEAVVSVGIIHHWIKILLG